MLIPQNDRPEEDRIHQVDLLPGGVISINGGDRTERVHPRMQPWIVDLHARHAISGDLYRGFVLSITDRCNIRCDYCCHPYMSTKISAEDSVRMVTEACDLPFAEIAVTGGEPYTRRRLLYELASICRERGKLFGSITNGFWAEDRNRAFQLAEEMVDAGIARVTFSWDPSHGEFVEPATIQNGVDACMEAGMRVTLTGSFKKEGDSHANYGIDVSAYDDYLNFRLNATNVAPAGWGKDIGPFHRNAVSAEDRKAFRCPGYTGHELVVYAQDGLTQPCCSVYAGYDMPELRVGDWRTTPVEQLLDAHMADGYYRIIVDNGFDLLYQVLAERAPEIVDQLPNADGAMSACELCEWLMVSPVARRIREVCDDYISDRLVEVLARHSDVLASLLPDDVDFDALGNGNGRRRDPALQAVSSVPLPSRSSRDAWS